MLKYSQFIQEQKLPDIEDSKRTFENLPRYSDGKAKVPFQKWLKIKKPDIDGLKDKAHSWGKGCDGKYYGWSHRAVFGFKIGDKIKEGDIAYGCYGKETTLKTEKEVAQHAINFAKDVS